ncbi:MAG: DUF3465 domain-containing protein [Gammaproteobacteria bacterium]|nr:DUF3465 domain-containing protein [Gammaproteobacteria bacterium]NND53791.1 DUF3465 domain-containing protein [Gammaproteobacteria bacterium]
MQKKIAALIVALIIAALANVNFPDVVSNGSDTKNAGTSTSSGSSDDVLAQAYADRVSDLWVQGSGRVDRVLADDNEGSRHQRFVLELNSGQSILIAHNIDLAPRIPDISRGDRVEFNGVYEYNDRGGVVHWTHHDPQGRMTGGWLRHNGATYK